MVPWTLETFQGDGRLGRAFQRPKIVPLDDSVRTVRWRIKKAKYEFFVVYAGVESTV